MATTFIINECIRNNWVFPRESVATLCRLGGWSEKAGTWALYVKDVFDKNLDGNPFLYRYGLYGMSSLSLIITSNKCIENIHAQLNDGAMG